MSKKKMRPQHANGEWTEQVSQT